MHYSKKSFEAQARKMIFYDILKSIQVLRACKMKTFPFNEIKLNWNIPMKFLQTTTTMVEIFLNFFLKFKGELCCLYTYESKLYIKSNLTISHFELNLIRRIISLMKRLRCQSNTLHTIYVIKNRSKFNLLNWALELSIG